MHRAAIGEPFRVGATTWNRLLGLLQTSPGPTGGAKGFRQSVTCLIWNQTGADLPRFGVVGLGEPVIDPGSNEDEFLRTVAFHGVLAEDGDYDLKWGLTIGPIKSGEFGEVIVQGLAYCYLDTADAETAGPADDGDVVALTSASCGLARVLWRQSGSGNKLAIVCLG